MPKRFLALLPLTIIVTACSSGVVDTWDPEADIKRSESNDVECQRKWESATHDYTSISQRLHIEGNTITSVYDSGEKKFCALMAEIGKTTRREIDGKRIKYALEDGNIVEYIADDGETPFKNVYERR